MKKIFPILTAIGSILLSNIVVAGYPSCTDECNGTVVQGSFVCTPFCTSSTNATETCTWNSMSVAATEITQGPPTTVPLPNGPGVTAGGTITPLEGCCVTPGNDCAGEE